MEAIAYAVFWVALFAAFYWLSGDAIPPPWPHGRRARVLAERLVKAGVSRKRAGVLAAALLALAGGGMRWARVGDRVSRVRANAVLAAAVVVSVLVLVLPFRIGWLCGKWLCGESLTTGAAMESDPVPRELRMVGGPTADARRQDVRKRRPSRQPREPAGDRASRERDIAERLVKGGVSRERAGVLAAALAALAGCGVRWARVVDRVSRVRTNAAWLVKGGVSRERAGVLAAALATLAEYGVRLEHVGDLADAYAMLASQPPRERAGVLSAALRDRANVAWLYKEGVMRECVGKLSAALDTLTEGGVRWDRFGEIAEAYATLTGCVDYTARVRATAERAVKRGASWERAWAFADADAMLNP